jgi:hypothetical protein
MTTPDESVGNSPLLPQQERSQPDSSHMLPSRQEIRSLVAEHSRELDLVIHSGGNVHQCYLDQADRVNAQARVLGPADGAVFLRIYAEEMEAADKHELELSYKALAEVGITTDSQGNVVLPPDTGPSEQDMANAERHLARLQSLEASPSWESQSLGEQIGRGVVGAVVVALIVGYCYSTR